MMWFRGDTSVKLILEYNHLIQLISRVILLAVVQQLESMSIDFVYELC